MGRFKSSPAALMTSASAADQAGGKRARSELADVLLPEVMHPHKNLQAVRGLSLQELISRIQTERATRASLHVEMDVNAQMIARLQAVNDSLREQLCQLRRQRRAI